MKILGRLDNGLILVQQKPVRAVELRTNHKQYGFIFQHGPERGQWITVRELNEDEIKELVS